MQYFVRLMTCWIILFALAMGLIQTSCTSSTHTQISKTASSPPAQPLPSLGNIPWRAHITSIPPGASIYFVQQGNSKLVGTTPADVDIWTEAISGNPGGKGKRTIIFHLPVLRTKDGFFCPFRIVMGDKQVEKYAFLWVRENLFMAISLPWDTAPKGTIDIGSGLLYDLKQGKGILFTGNLTFDEIIPASFATSFPPPRISEITVDFNK